VCKCGVGVNNESDESGRVRQQRADRKGAIREIRAPARTGRRGTRASGRQEKEKEKEKERARPRWRCFVAASRPRAFRGVGASGWRGSAQVKTRLRLLSGSASPAAAAGGGRYVKIWRRKRPGCNSGGVGCGLAGDRSAVARPWHISQSDECDRRVVPVRTTFSSPSSSGSFSRAGPEPLKGPDCPVPRAPPHLCATAGGRSFPRRRACGREGPGEGGESSLG
jgi:hypothetical protein